MVLLARHCVSEGEGPVQIAGDFASAAGAEITPEFESQPLWRSVESQISAAGAHSSPPGEAGAMLFIHTPLDVQRDISQAPPVGQAPSLALQAERVIERLQAARAAGRLVGLADVAYCNGADPELIAALARTGARRDLQAFAGWNTAGNTVGTVVSQLCIQAVNVQHRGSAPHDSGRSLLLHRFIDDYGYQSCVRRRTLAHAEALGASPYALGEAREELEQYVTQELAPFAQEFCADSALCGDGEAPGEVRASLPWGRLFEVELEQSSS
jgi:hypothetical protein